MLDCTEKVQKLQRRERRINSSFVALYMRNSVITDHIWFVNINRQIGY